MRPPWTQRRRVVFGTLVMCAVVVLRFTFMPTAGVDPELAKMISLGVLGLAGTTIGTYVFGAAWDDRNVMTLIGEKAYAGTPAASDGWPQDIAMPEPPPPNEYRTGR